jgi:long-chain acyl-CoA synthetase
MVRPEARAGETMTARQVVPLREHVNRIISSIPAWEGALHFYERGKVVSYRAEAVRQDIRRTLAAFEQSGYRPGDRIGIVGPNSYAWVLLDLASLAFGITVVGIDPMDEGVAARAEKLGLAAVYRLPYDANAADLTRPNEPRSVEREARVFEPDDVVGLKFTSGTTGGAKAIEVKRKSLDDSLESVQQMFAHGPGDNILIFLPLHLIQQRYWIYSAILFGHDAIVVPYRLALTALERLSPTVVMGVPEFYDALIAGFDTNDEGERQRLRASFGGKIRYLWTGSAPIRRATLQTCGELGLPIYEGYGMNETCIISKNFPGNHRVGSVGKVLPSKTVRFDENSQIVVHCQYEVNDRYLNAEGSEGAGVFLGDGWVATGDVGYQDPDGYLYITGRMKEIIVLSSGRNVSPLPIEERLSKSSVIDRAVVFGSGRSFLTALVVPASTDVTREELERDIAAANAASADYERVRKFVVASEPLSRENGLLSSQFKVRRKVVWQKYGEQIVRLYEA